MGRWQPDARGRLLEAALDLYTERGFEKTTALEVARRANVTERTFFRYFADKREVLFEGSATLQDAIVTAIMAAPESIGPIEVVGRAMQSVDFLFRDRRDFVRQRAAVIAATPSLQERELLKLAALAKAVADALRRRGVAESPALLTAEVGVSIFKTGFERWIGDDSVESLEECVGEAVRQLRELTATRGTDHSPVGQ